MLPPKLINLNINPVLPPGAVYIGRPCLRYKSAVDWGNPIHVSRTVTREQAIAQHWQTVHSDPQMIACIRQRLQGRDLACYCTPASCHGETLLRIANSYPEVKSFSGIFQFLSNFHPAEIRTASGVVYPTSEHAYQAAKFTDPERRLLIAHAATPGRAKRLGRLPGCRPDWEYVKIRIMRKILRAKFRQNPELGRALMDTRGAILVEGNTWGDTFWGVCGGVGRNILGKLLMELRDLLLRQHGFA